MQIEHSYVRESTRDGVAYEGRVVNFDLDGAIILQPRAKRQDSSPDFTIGYLIQPRNGRSRWVDAGVAWLNDEREPDTIPGGKYLTLRFKLKSGDMTMFAFPQVDEDGALLPDWTLEMCKASAEQALDDHNPF
ncbi:MAG: hypothetical protein CL559_08175 [Alphaproteobacteria bacterium]|nr:hypothetical protein [Alphaproteobacteria bacterium]